MDWNAQPATQLIIDAWRHGRPIVPFLGAGVSLAAGFPTRSRLTAYLAKVQFALDRAIFRSRYPMVSESADTAIERYRRRPADFIADFGWPELGQLNADIWRWLSDPPDRDPSDATKRIDLRNGFTTHDDIVQWVFRRRLSEAEPHLVAAIDQKSASAATTLHGDWTGMLEHLTEGQLDLIDSLFAGLDHAREPTLGHVYLTFLSQLMGIRLILSTNFDTLLEKAMHREGIAPRVFDIHRDADLPHIGLVRNQLSLVKLHGSAYGLRFGERLQYSLDIEARNRLCGYVPDDALLVVLGFSGFERRMVQAIAHIAKRPPAGRAAPQVLWLSPTNQPANAPFLKDLVDDLRAQGLTHAFLAKRICDANTFLSDLAFCIGSSFPAFRHKYDALMSRPMLLSLGSTTSESALPATSMSETKDGFALVHSPASYCRKSCSFEVKRSGVSC